MLGAATPNEEVTKGYNGFQVKTTASKQEHHNNPLNITTTIKWKKSMERKEGIPYLKIKGNVKVS